MCKRDTVELIDDGPFHIRIGMAKTGNGRTTASVEILVPVGVIDEHSFTTCDNRQSRFRKSVKDMIHGLSRWRDIRERVRWRTAFAETIAIQDMI